MGKDYTALTKRKGEFEKYEWQLFHDTKRDPKIESIEETVNNYANDHPCDTPINEIKQKIHNAGH